MDPIMMTVAANWAVLRFRPGQDDVELARAGSFLRSNDFMLDEKLEMLAEGSTERILLIFSRTPGGAVLADPAIPGVTFVSA